MKNIINMMWHTGLLSLLLVSLVVGNIDNKKHNKYVTTLINAKWNETPIVLEISEYLNEKNPSYFWKFIDSVSNDNKKNGNPINEKEEYDRSLLLAGEFLSSTEISLLKLTLSLRIHSARVEMFSQMAELKKQDINAINNNINNCHNFVDINGKFTCNIDEIDDILLNYNYDELNDDKNDNKTYSIDHEYPILSKTTSSLPVVILYGQIGTDGFNDFHVKLKQLTDDKKIKYILRHNVKKRSDNLLRLSGYGVELQMKSTEYKATDDTDIKDNNDNKNSQDNNDGVEEIDGINFNKLKKLYPDKLNELDKLQNHLLDTSDEISALKVWQFQELSHQAAQRILSSASIDAINVLTDISQNFPMQAKSLIRIKVNNEMKKEMKANQEIFFSNLHIQPSDTAFFINGLFFDLDSIDILSIIDTLRSELIVMESIYKIGINNKKMDKLLSLDLSNGNSDNQEFAIDIRDTAIIWINDLEKDLRYNRWSSSLTSLLRPTFPGMLRNIRRNMYNLVLIIDPLSELSKPLLSTVEALHSHSAPIRVGFVFLTNSNKLLTGFNDPSIAVNNAYHYLADTKGHKHAVEFLSSLLTYKKNKDNKTYKLTVDDIKKLLLKRDSSANIDYIFDEESEYDVGRYLANDFIKRTGFKKFPQALMNGIPLPSTSTSDADSFEETVLSSIMTQTPILQKAVYKGEVNEGDNIIDFIMEQPNVMPRLNEKILKNDPNQWLNLIGNVQTINNNNNNLINWSIEDTSAWIMKNSNYLLMQKRNNKIKHYHYTYWIIVDLENKYSRKLLREAIHHLETTSDVRMTIIISKKYNNNNNFNNINNYALTLLNTKKTLSKDKLILYMKKLIQEETYDNIINNKFNYNDYDDILYDNNNDNELMLNIHNYFVDIIADNNLLSNKFGVICNGRLIGPFDDDELFTREDFSLLEKYSYSTYGEKLNKIIDEIETFTDDDDDDDDDDEEDNDIDDVKMKEITDDTIMQISSLLVPRQQTRIRYEIPSSGENHSVVKVKANDKKNVAFNLVGIVDPVSRGAQKLGAILSTLQKSLNCNIKIYLNCVDKNSDMPLKSFYRFVFDSELQFTNDGNVAGAVAKFTKLPTSSLLTQYIHAPENWLVQVVQSVYDLDNIKLDNVAIGVHSEYELEYLLLEGHCFEASMGNPPRGLQMTLGTEIQPVMVDTIVMANLGYFQLKANPGEWLLRLRQGRSSEIYDINSVDGQDAIQNGNQVKVLISSLKSHVLKLKVTKKPDKLAVDLLGEDDKKSGIWNSISRTFGSEDGEEKEEKINIFSLASGHLYERFLKIMMLSVLKHTKSPVKFWFLKNYLSPTLKDFLPHMAEEYGFEYELVEYKWPRWLHQQTEKQRTIWGYKILFLDVLFPLDVKKIIFVDADQVVRADLNELVELDLEGAPYAYTPFCDSRREMDGFRFWKQGYWKTHLQGRSYHISALYVVDLQRFRRIAAGDRLRGQYQALSSDPNSLSNLDQDLPNNMIHQVAIKTLPQDWLWCETWCSDKSKKNAKTIDLCNNPQTKEAKLQAAMRILPEWTGYDDEIKKLQQKIENSNKLHEEEDKVDTVSDDLEKHEEL